MKNKVITIEEANKMTAFGVYTFESKLNGLTYVTIDVQDWDDNGNFTPFQETYILKTW